MREPSRKANCRIIKSVLDGIVDRPSYNDTKPDVKGADVGIHDQSAA
jgi:hypothetical protein